VNLDLLIKLVKLANHNNSEGEANSAARRVCKMIEENNFAFNSTRQTPPRSFDEETPRESPTGRRYRGGWDYGFSDMYEEVLRRAREAAAREQKRQADLNEKIRKEREAERKKREEPIYEQHERPRWNWGYNPTPEQEDFFRRTQWGHEQPKNEGTERECTKCQLKVKTFNTKNPFICSICLLRDWT